MKHLKMLGLAAIAAMGLMAFVGAGSASATTLFTSSNLTNPYAVGPEVHSTLTTGSTALLTGSGGEVLDKCTGSTVKGSISTATGTAVVGSIGTLTWENCSVTTDTVAGGSLEIIKTGTNEGEVRGKGSEVTVNIFGVSCTYGTGTGTKLGTLTGGSAPILKIAAVNLTKTAGGFLCPSNPGWDAEYTVTTPHAVFIGA